MKSAVLDFTEVFKPYDTLATLSSIPEWWAIGVVCARCKRTGWLDRPALIKRYGRDKKVHELQPGFRCVVCSNKGRNRLIAMKLPR